MFSNKRFLTRGVDAEIPIELQMIMWAMIDNRKASGAELDYLQIFQLSPQSGKQKVVHSQERPEYTNEILVPLVCSPVETRIWVIDD